ncbi:hypothetical protein [Microbacterium sp. P5_E9]
MNYSTVVAASRLEHDRASALDREIELRRRISDRGTTITPTRPAVNPRRVIGVWFRGLKDSGHVRVSY